MSKPGKSLNQSRRDAPLAARPPRWWRSAPGTAWLTAMFLTILALLISESTPEQTFLRLSAYAAGAILALIWLVRLVAWRLYDQRVPDRRWGIAPAAGLVAAVLIVGALPLRARFELARDDFNEAVTAMPPMGCGEVPSRVGSYDTLGFTRIDENTFFYTGVFLFDAYGFAHLPKGPDAINAVPSYALRIEVRELGGGWYEWSGNLPSTGFAETPHCNVRRR